ncbi:hypothetical protein KFL_004020140 [Klebsormidium nitens]|uniref:Uncharacterized protein n=1 Tax=Klebsormidium nitens TaxID=105231 RepID=A0A1Y1IJ36_KLENI|nr:hypothetical protein KFL_004020140 [Klebsormidium nitens]|eukprot:GAQ88128.1 hypothetical protein KFL_004020140 [Klebsormidium nitens]
MGAGQVAKGVSFSRQLLRTLDLVQQSAARASAAARQLDIQLAPFSTAPRSGESPSQTNVERPASLYHADSDSPKPSITNSFASRISDSLKPGTGLRGFATQSTAEAKAPVESRQAYDKRVREVRKKYIEELAEKRRREAAFEQKKREIYAARRQDVKEAKLAALREDAQEKERLLEEQRQRKELRRQEGQQRLLQVKAALQAQRDGERALIVASSQTWVKEGELEARIELALDNPFAL